MSYAVPAGDGLEFDLKDYVIPAEIVFELNESEKENTVSFNALAWGSGKYIKWNVYARKVTDLSLALNTGTWIDLNPWIRSEDDLTPKLPNIVSGIEYSVGIPIFDSLTLTGLDVKWWKNNIFNASDSEYIELKVEFRLGLSPAVMASDVVYTFSGFIDKNPINNELDDSVTFKVYTVDELGQRLSAETITRQIITKNFDGSGTSGLFLGNLPGICVVNANVAGYVLKQGVHTIAVSYSSDGPAWTAALDGGVEATLPSSNGVVMLTNKDGDQQVNIYVVPASLSTADSLSQEIIVVTQGNVLPRTWYNYVVIFDLLKLLYAKLGISTLEYDDLIINTWDGRNTTAFYGVPPGGEEFYKPSTALVFDNINNKTMIALTDKIYAFDPVGRTYTYRAILPSGNEIRRFFPGRISNDELWGIAVNTSTYAVEIFKMILSTNIVSSWILSNTSCLPTYNQIYYLRHFALAKNIGTSGIIYFLNAANSVYTFDMNSHAETKVVDLTGMPGQGCNYPSITDGTNYLFQHNDGGDILWEQVTYNQVTWTVAMVKSSNVVFIEGIYANNSYYVSEAFSGYTDWSLVKYNILNSYSWARLGTGGYNFEVNGTILSYLDVNLKGMICNLANDALTTQSESILFPVASDSVISNQRISYDVAANSFWLLYDKSNILGQYCSEVPMYISTEFDCTQAYVTDQINALLASFNMTATIGSNKVAKFYRRSDLTGKPVTSGNTLAITLNGVEDITEEVAYQFGAALVKVSNQNSSASYDGSVFDLGLMKEGITVDLTNNYLPDVLLKDMAYYNYQFFKDPHILYTIPTANIHAFQFGCFDELSITFTGKIQKVASGPIYGCELMNEGMQLKVLI